MPKISEEQRQKRMNLILDHAFNLFVAKGFLKTSMEDIVQSSGVSKGGIYTYFSSKEDIFLKMAEDRLIERKKYYQTLPKKLSSEEKLRRNISYILNKLTSDDYLKGIKFINEFWAIKCREEGYQEITLRRVRLFSEDIIEIIKEGQGNGEFNKDVNPHAMAFIVISVIDGSAGTSGIMREKITQEIIDETIDMVIGYLSK